MGGRGTQTKRQRDDARNQRRRMQSAERRYSGGGGGGVETGTAQGKAIKGLLDDGEYDADFVIKELRKLPNRPLVSGGAAGKRDYMDYLGGDERLNKLYEELDSTPIIDFVKYGSIRAKIRQRENTLKRKFEKETGRKALTDGQKDRLRELIEVKDGGMDFTPNTSMLRFMQLFDDDGNIKSFDKDKMADTINKGGSQMRRFVSKKLTVGNVSFRPTNSKRASFSGNAKGDELGGVVRVPETAGWRTVVHELGHAVETNNPQAFKNAKRFYEYRTKGDSPKNLRALYLNTRFRDDEYVKTDRFHKTNLYAGKAYYNSKNQIEATELISLGMEFMTSNPKKFAQADPEYFKFVYDTLRGREWKPPKGSKKSK